MGLAELFEFRTEATTKKNIRQKFFDFCKKFGKLEISGNSLQCYIEPETIERNVGEFTIELNELVRQFTKDWYAWVRPEYPDIVLEFDRYLENGNNVGMEITIHGDADKILIAMDSEGLMVQGRREEERGCTLMIDKITGSVAVTCLGTLDSQDPRISSVSARAKL